MQKQNIRSVAIKNGSDPTHSFGHIRFNASSDANCILLNWLGWTQRSVYLFCKYPFRSDLYGTGLFTIYAKIPIY